MKSVMLRTVWGIVLMVGFAVLFTQCETDLNGLDSEEAQELIVETRGVVDCPFNPDGPFNPAYNGGNGPAISVEEMCSRLSDLPVQELSEAETEALLFMREEEKLARDVYLALSAKWNVPVFEFISKSEQRHMDAVGCLLTKYGLTDPVGDNLEGIFVNEDLQTLYGDLMETGLVSLEAAYTVGANIEDLDIKDLMEALEDVDNDDIRAVFENLTKGSRNHLRAFVGHLDNLGVTYEPVYLLPEVYTAIITSTFEKGSGVLCGTCPYSNAVGVGVCDGTGPAYKTAANQNANSNNGKGKKVRKRGR